MIQTIQNIDMETLGDELIAVLENENIDHEVKIKKFQDIEQTLYKGACDYACQICTLFLQNCDKKIMEKRNKAIYRHRGQKKTSIKTIMGEVYYSRALYENAETKETIYLLDKALQIAKIGNFSANMVEKVLETVVNTNSYRKASTELKHICNQTISHQAIKNLVWKVGEMIEEKENQEIKLMKEEKLVQGTKEIPALFEEADGIWYNLQGKDRKKAQEKYKKKCEREGKEYNPYQKCKKELKLHVMYEGWEKESRHKLVGKKYIAGMMSPERLKKLRNARVFQRYNEKSIELRALNGDGASPNK